MKGDYKKLKKLDPRSSVRPGEMTPQRPGRKEVDPGSSVREGEFPPRGKKPRRRG